MWTSLVVLTLLARSCGATGGVDGLNRTLVVTSILMDPFLMNATSNGTEDFFGFRGYIPELLHAIAKFTKLEFSVQLTSDGQFGRKMIVGDVEKWTGMMGDVVEGRADFAAAPLTVSAEREEAADFTQPFMETGLTFMIAKPQLETSFVSLFDVVNVVAGEVWGLILVAIFVITLSLTLIDHFYHDNGPAAFGWRDGSFFLFSTALWQGYSKAPHSLGARVMSIFWWFFCAVFLMSYSASLVHVFALKVQTLPKLPAMTPEDLLTQSQVKYFPLAGGSTKAFFANSDVHLIEKLWIGMKAYGEDKFPQTVEDGINMVRARNGTYAFFGESRVFDHFANQDPDCGLLVSDQHIDKKLYGLAVAKNRPQLLKALSDAIVSLDDIGFTDALYKKYFADKCKDHSIQQHAEDRLQLQRQPITLSNFGGIFILLLIGICVGFLIFGAEIVIMRRYGKGHIPAMLLNEANMAAE